jgi:class 3 adenylate cyclase
MSVAGPGEVLVTGATWHRLGAPRPGDSLGSVTVKGRREPVDIWRLLAS